MAKVKYNGITFDSDLELWEDIENFEEYYKISNCGRVKSLDRITNHNRKIKGRILIPRLTKTGYCRVQLYKDGISEDWYIHRLVAIHFVENVSDYEEINHKDGIKGNNCDWNIEWCSRTDNNLHSYYILKNETGCIPKRKVKSINLKNNKITIFETIMNAERWLRKIGYSKALHGNISAVCRGRYKYAYGHKWEYINEVTV